MDSESQLKNATGTFKIEMNEVTLYNETFLLFNTW